MAKTEGSATLSLHHRYSYHSIRSLGLDDFYYDNMEATECVSDYMVGGYHPIIIGDILGPPNCDEPSRKYRIMSKLGYVSNATVWLAQNTASAAFVALKVTTARLEGEVEREAAILEAARDIQPEPPNVLSLLDHFPLKGPNGTHAVIVTDVIVSILPFLRYIRPPRWYKHVAYDIAQGLAHLHAAGIVHGDLHLGNIGFVVPALAQQDPFELMDELSPGPITLVLPADVMEQTSSLPAYLVEPSGTEHYMKLVGLEPARAKIIDFGSAHTPIIPPLYDDAYCAIVIYPPELAFAKFVEETGNPPPEPPADIWAFGADLFEAVTGSRLLPLYASPTVFGSLAVIGDIPEHWQKSWEASSSYEPNKISPNVWWEQRRVALQKRCEDEEDTDALLRLLRKVLVLDPAKRPTAAQIMCDPWFRDMVPMGIDKKDILPFNTSTLLSSLHST